jgi:hypothetical protein
MCQICLDAGWHHNKATNKRMKFSVSLNPGFLKLCIQNKQICSCKHQAPLTSCSCYHSVNCSGLHLWDSALWMCQNESIFCVLADGDSGCAKGWRLSLSFITHFEHTVQLVFYYASGKATQRNKSLSQVFFFSKEGGNGGWSVGIQATNQKHQIIIWWRKWWKGIKVYSSVTVEGHAEGVDVDHNWTA